MCVESLLESRNLLKLVVFCCHCMWMKEKLRTKLYGERKKTWKLNSNARCMLLEQFTIISRHLKLACKSIAWESENRRKIAKYTTRPPTHAIPPHIYLIDWENVPFIQITVTFDKTTFTSTICVYRMCSFLLYSFVRHDRFIENTYKHKLYNYHMFVGVAQICHFDRFREACLKLILPKFFLIIILSNSIPFSLFETVFTNDSFIWRKYVWIFFVNLKWPSLPQNMYKKIT